MPSRARAARKACRRCSARMRAPSSSESQCRRRLFSAGLGVKRILNARGAYTDLGGSTLAPAVWAAMEESNRYFADIPELLRRSGQAIATLVGAEAARVTPGAAAAIALGTAACLTRGEPEKIDRLPG